MKFKIPILKGKSIILRPLKMEDAKIITELINDKKVAEYLGHNIPYPYHMKDAESWLKSQEKKKDGFSLAITDRKTGDLMGSIGIEDIGKNEDYKVAQLGYWIGRKYWGKGYATEAAKLMVDYGFEKLRLRRIYAKTDSPNIGSQRVLEKLGFRLEGRFREQVKHRFSNKWFDLLSYGLLRREWR